MRSPTWSKWEPRFSRFGGMAGFFVVGLWVMKGGSYIQFFARFTGWGLSPGKALCFLRFCGAVLFAVCFGLWF